MKSKEEIDRKIAVIFTTDVVGYSKHMEKDENGTLLSLRECFSYLESAILRGKGRVFNRGGDSLLAEFPSAVSALEIAVQFQKMIITRNNSESDIIKLQFRIGINMGDVIIDHDNLLGDGVNIAARLEALAQPNGISLSKSIYDLVKAKTDFTYVDLGEQKVKENVFHAFDILVEPSQRRPRKSKGISFISVFIALVMSSVILLGLLLLSGFFKENKTDVLISDKPSVLIKPFLDRSNGNSNAHISEGMTDTIISVLSQYPQLIVQSRSTSDFILKQEYADIEIRDLYGIKYILRGTNQIANSKIRTNVELSDIEESQIIWSEKYDFELTDIFGIQDSIAESILNQLQIKLTTGKKLSDTRKYFKTAETWSLAKSAHINYMKCDQEGVATATSQFAKLLKIEPNNPVILVDYAWYLTCKYITGLMDEGEIPNIAKNMNDLVDKAIKSGPDYGFAFVTKAGLLAKQAQLFPNMDEEMRIKNAIITNRKGISLDPAGLTTLGTAGNTFTQLKMPNEAERVFQKAVDLVPYPPGNIKLNYAFSLTSFGQFEKGYQLAEELSLTKQYFGDAQLGALGIMAYIHMKEENPKKAREKVEEIYQISESTTVKSMMRSMKTFISTDEEFLNDLSITLFEAGIKKSE